MTAIIDARALDEIALLLTDDPDNGHIYKLAETLDAIAKLVKGTGRKLNGKK